MRNSALFTSTLRVVLSASLYVCVYVCLCVCVYVCLCVCLCACQLVPLLKLLYHAPDSGCHHLNYMALIVILILSEDSCFSKSVHEIVSAVHCWTHWGWLLSLVVDYVVTRLLHQPNDHCLWWWWWWWWWHWWWVLSMFSLCWHILLWALNELGHRWKNYTISRPIFFQYD